MVAVPFEPAVKLSPLGRIVLVLIVAVGVPAAEMAMVPCVPTVAVAVAGEEKTGT